MTLCTLIISAHYNDVCTQGSVVLCTHKRLTVQDFVLLILIFSLTWTTAVMIL